MKKITLLLTALLLIGCSSTSKQHSADRRSFNVSQTEKRLNTAECHDLDDWYLDGFRVGKTHRPQGENLLAQRIKFCENQSEVTEQMKSMWRDGFDKSATYQGGKKRRR